MPKEIKTVADLPNGPFHLVVVQVEKTAIPILDGEITSVKGEKQIKDLANSEVHEADTVVLLFQKREKSKIFK